MFFPDFSSALGYVYLKRWVLFQSAFILIPPSAKSFDYTVHPNTKGVLAGNSQAGSTWSTRMSQIGVLANGYLKHLLEAIGLACSLQQSVCFSLCPK